MKKTQYFIFVNLLFCYVSVAFWCCKEPPKSDSVKFFSKSAQIKMNIPKTWVFQSNAVSTDTSTKWHEQYKRTDHSGFIDIEIKSNQTYSTLSSEEILKGIIQSMKTEADLYKDLAILNEGNKSGRSIVICRYIWGKKDELTYALIAVSKGKKETKTIKVETWDQSNDNQQRFILTRIRNSLKM